MSVPARLQLPPGVMRREISTARGAAPALYAPSSSSAAGVPAVLVPGYTGSKEDFLTVAEPLAAAGVSAYAVDLRGQYGSYVTDDPAAYAWDALAADVLAVVAAVAAEHGTDRVHLLGHSFGGLVVRAAALRDPAPLRSLTLMSSGPGALPGASGRRHLLRLLLQELPKADLEQIYARKRELELAAGTPAAEPDVEAFLRERFLANCATGLRCMAEHLLDEPDRTDELAAVADAHGVSLHVIYGQHDDAWPTAVQADMARRLGARATVITDAAHSPAAEQPEATAAALAEFWADSSLALPVARPRPSAGNRRGD